MKRFQTSYREIVANDNRYLVIGRNVGTEIIRIGDSLNGLTVSDIEAYERRIGECHPGMTAKLTLIRQSNVSDQYDFPLTLNGE